MSRQSCRCNFLSGAGSIFGFEIEKLIFGKNFGYREYNFFVFNLYKSAGKFLSINKLFNQCLGAFFPGL